MPHHYRSTTITTLFLSFFLSFQQLTLSFTVVSPSSIAGYYPSPPCAFNNLNNYNSSTVWELVYIDFDFCSEFTGEINNIKDVVLLIKFNNCFPPKKTIFAKKAGAQQIILQSVSSPPGVDVYLHRMEQGAALVSVVVDTYTINFLKKSSLQSNVTVILTSGMQYFFRLYKEFDL